MTHNKWLIIIAGLCILTAIIFLVKCPNEHDVGPLPIPKTALSKKTAKTTDSLKKVIKSLDTLFKQSVAEAIKPDTFIDYVMIDSLKREIRRDDSTRYLIIIDSLNREIARVSELYITRAPTAPKLISGGFTGNSIAFNLLKPNGDIAGTIYQVDYNNYTYMYDSMGLHTMPILKRPEIAKKNLRTEAYGYVDYDPFHKFATVSADYLLTYKNYSAYTRIGLQLGPVVKTETRIGIRISLK